MKQILKDKVVVITGGTKGLGKGVALGALEEGAKVVISGRKEEEGAATVAEANALGYTDILFVRGEITQTEDCKALIDAAVAKFGRVNCLFNYAGVLPAASLLETDEKTFDDVMRLNIRAPFFLCKYAIMEMQKVGSGSIVNTCSPHSYAGDYDRAAYAVSKGALLTLTRHVARNYRTEQIRANSITMGWVATDGEMALRHEQGHDLAWLENEAKKHIPMGRLQTVEDHVPAILFLLSDQSSQITNTEMHITGGMFHA